MNATAPNRSGDAAPGSPSFRHVILTRFNVPFGTTPSGAPVGRDPHWLEERFGLFEKYCLPSVISQTEQDFDWIIYFDRQTPEPARSQAQAIASRRPRTFVVFCDECTMPVVHQSIRDTGAPADWLLTTRFDNDDGLHQDFVACVQGSQRFAAAEVLNCTRGIVVQSNRAYVYRHPSNAFISLSEPWKDFRTVLSINGHNSARRSYPVRQVAGVPMWLQVIHGTNLSNRVRGWRIPLRRAAVGFAALDPAPAPENELDILLENTTSGFVRYLRDWAISSARSVAILLGRDLRRKPVVRIRAG